MIEIISRANENNEIYKDLVKKGRPQISYNSDGRLVIRIIHGDNSDSLIVMNKKVSQEIIEFCQQELSEKL